MKHLFTAEGMAALAATMARAPLLAFDFDGTLAAIVPQPEEARITQAVAWRLQQLASQLPLAIITGRAVDDVRSRLHFEPRYIIGNHGAEDPAAAADAHAPMALDLAREQLARHAGALQAAGVTVEDKRYSIALHYRLARERAQALELIRSLATGFGPAVRAFGGKLVVNLVDAQAPDKADAVATLAQRCGSACVLFVGDDVNDEPVFLRARPCWLTVKVGRDDPQSRALFLLDNPGEVAMLLDRMLATLGPPA